MAKTKGLNRALSLALVLALMCSLLVALPTASAASSLPTYRDSDRDGVTDMLGTGQVVSIEYGYVGLYNAFASNWSMLNSGGKTMAGTLATAAASYDGKTKTAPDDYSNAAKIYAVFTELLGETVTVATVGDAPTEAELLTALGGYYTATMVTDFYAQLSKIETVELLYSASAYVQSKTSPGDTWATQTGSANSDMTQFFMGTYDDTEIITDDQTAITSTSLIGSGTALLLNNLGGTLTISNKTVSTTGASAAGAYIVGARDVNTSKDGAPDPDTKGFVYNAVGRNAYYRDGIGAGITLWGASTVVEMSSNNGTLVLDGASSGSMAGTAYVGFSSALKISNAVAYSAGQHLTNLLFNGTIHYKDAYAIGSGRAYSSDFWGGYMVFENSIASARSGQFTDEPTSIVVKNSVFDASLQGTGMASQYLENSILNTGAITYSNNTSGMSDTASLTLVNSVVNSTGTALAGTVKGNRAIITMVDSEINLPNGNVLANVTVRGSNQFTTTSVDPDELAAFKALYNGEMVYNIYGNNTIYTSDGTLTVNVAEGAKLTINYNNLTGGTITKTGDGTLVVNSGDSDYGNLAISTYVAPTANGSYVEKKYHSDNLVLSATVNGEIDVNSSTQTPSDNTTVTLEVNPDRGYELNELTVLDKDENTIMVTPNSGDYEFTYLDAEAPYTIEATFKAVSTSGIVGLLSLNKYVFTASEISGNGGTLSVDAYGAYVVGAGGASHVVDTTYDGSELKFYKDSALKDKFSAGELAYTYDDASNGKLELSGTALTGIITNFPIYVSAYDGAYTTIIYVVGKEYNTAPLSNAATLTLADDENVTLTKYAPNLASGTYTATVASVNTNRSVYIGGNKTVTNAAYYGISDPDEATAVNWYLQSGITNAGDTLTGTPAGFGAKMYVFDYAMAMYRMFQLVVDQITTYKDFVDFTDYVGGMGNNDTYGDAVNATTYAGIWNGIYTTYATYSNGTGVLDSGAKGTYPGFYLLNNLGATIASSGTGTGTTSASISPTTATFDKRSGSANYKDIEVKLTSAGYTLEGLYYGTELLEKGTDYTVSGSTYTISKSFLKNLSVGSQKITFQMSGGTNPVLTVTVTQSSAGWSNPFNDVSSGSWYYDAVEWVNQQGLMVGMTEDNFAPQTEVSRAMLATIIWRNEGSPSLSYDAENPFSDLTQDWYKTAVIWCSENNIVNGYGDGTFGPNDSITREQFVTILHRYSEYKGYIVTQRAELTKYTDAGQISSWALEAMKWAVAEGIINGRTDTQLAPKGTTTRAETAVILYRFLG